MEREKEIKNVEKEKGKEKEVKLPPIKALHVDGLNENEFENKIPKISKLLS